MLAPEAQQEQENLLGEVIAFRAILQSYQEDGQAALSLCQQALSLLSADNFMTRAYQSACAQTRALIILLPMMQWPLSRVGCKQSPLPRRQDRTRSAIAIMGTTVCVHDRSRAIARGTAADPASNAIGDDSQEDLSCLRWAGPLSFKRRSCASGTSSMRHSLWQKRPSSYANRPNRSSSLVYFTLGYAMLLRISLSRGELDAARSALQQFEHIGMKYEPASLSLICVLSSPRSIRSGSGWPVENWTVPRIGLKQLEMRRATWHSLCS